MAENFSETSADAIGRNKSEAVNRGLRAGFAQLPLSEQLSASPGTSGPSPGKNWRSSRRERGESFLVAFTCGSLHLASGAFSQALKSSDSAAGKGLELGLPVRPFLNRRCRRRYVVRAPSSELRVLGHCGSGLLPLVGLLLCLTDPIATGTVAAFLPGESDLYRHCTMPPLGAIIELSQTTVYEEGVAAFKPSVRATVWFKWSSDEKRLVAEECTLADATPAPR